MAEVELIAGPAGSGKTARAMAAFREELAARQRQGRLGAALWITPTQRSRKQVLRNLLGDRLEACFAPQVLTFDEFADALLRSSPEPIRPLSRIAKRKLLRDLIDDLARRRKLKHFGPVAGTAGFLELCVSFISELKREEIWPEDFEQGCRGLPDDDPPGEPAPKRKRGSPKDRELSAIYDAYQRRLHDGRPSGRDATAGLYDGEGRFWSARTLMRRGHRGPFRGLTLVVVDGFTDFTRTQYEMLAALAGWTERMLVTLPLDGPGRADLFEKPLAARGELTKALADHRLTEVRLHAPPDFAASAWGHLSAELFSNPREVRRRTDATGLAVLSCVRRSGEIEEIAKRVKRLLAAGVPADDVVVAFRSLDGLADLVRETFDAAGVPAAVETGPPVAKTGAVRFLLAVLDLEREDWPFPRLAGVLNSTFFRPDWLASDSQDPRETTAPAPSPLAVSRRPAAPPHGTPTHPAPAAVTRTLRALNLDGRRETILAALGRRAEQPNKTDAETVRLAWETLRRLSDELAPLRDRGTFAEWVDRLLRVATALRSAPAPAPDEQPPSDDPLAAAEAGGWQAFVRLIEEAKKAETLAGGPARKLGLAEFRKQLDELLAGQTWEADDPEDGAVRVLSAEQVRNLDVPHLFLAGLSESSFPCPRGEDCLYGDAERHRLNAGGLPLGHRARRGREEMLLFYGIVTRARRSLTLSFPSVDEGGEPLYPSPYLSSVRDLFTPEALPVESCGQLDPVPAEAAACVTEAELRTFAAREALAGRAGLFSALAERRESWETALNVAAAADMTAARFATRGLTNYEGLLADPRNLKRLRQRFGGGHEFSATELETYAAHPLRFFLLYVLGLEPARDPGPATDFARRGSVLHAALAATHRRIAEEVAETAASDALESLIQAEVERAHRLGADSPLQRALHRIERDVLSKRAVRYVPQWEKYVSSFAGIWDSPPTPAHFEVAFGNAPAEEGEPEGPRHPVVEFGGPDGRVRVRGRIDRIDLGVADGKPVFNVIDYKLGRPPRFSGDDVGAGRSLQLAVYASAARRLGIVNADLYQLAFWGLGGDGFVNGLKGRQAAPRPIDPEAAAALEADLDRVLPRLADSIRSGVFPVVPDDPDEAYNADYAAVARTGPFRAVVDLLEKHAPRRDPAAPA